MMWNHLKCDEPYISMVESGQISAQNQCVSRQVLSEVDRRLNLGLNRIIPFILSTNGFIRIFSRSSTNIDIPDRSSRAPYSFIAFQKQQRE